MSQFENSEENFVDSTTGSSYDHAQLAAGASSLLMKNSPFSSSESGDHVTQFDATPPIESEQNANSSATNSVIDAMWPSDIIPATKKKGKFRFLSSDNGDVVSNANSHTNSESSSEWSANVYDANSLEASDCADFGITSELRSFKPVSVNDTLSTQFFNGPDVKTESVSCVMADSLTDMSTQAASGHKLKSRWLTRGSKPDAGALFATSSPQNSSQPENYIFEADSSSSPTVSPSFVYIKENEYAFAVDKKRSKKADRRMVCECSTSVEERADGHVACGSDCLNKLLYVECGSRCPCGEYCTNKRFQKKQYAKLEVFDTGLKGYGLRAKEFIPRGSFIIEYIGEVLNPSQFKQRTQQLARDPEHRHYYFMALKSEEIIDATLKGNISRFVNHSCEPNAETQKWTVNGDLRIGFFTIRDVEVGDEITFDYQFQRYGKAAQKCYCGSSRCLGFIGGEKQTIDLYTVEDLESETSQLSDVSFDSSDRRRRNRAEKKQCFEDVELQREISQLLAVGCLRKRDQVLQYCRLMVRVEIPSTRLRLLDVLSNTEDFNLLRLFLDYHGLSLLWSWMVAWQKIDNVDELEFRWLVLCLLRKLPIPHSTMLKDSKVLSVVERWSRPSVATAASAALFKLESNSRNSAEDQENSGTSTPESRRPSATVEADVAEVLNCMLDQLCLQDKLQCAAPIDERDRLTQTCDLAVALLAQWSTLKELFKIPRKTELELQSAVSKLRTDAHRNEEAERSEARFTYSSALGGRNNKTLSYNVHMFADQRHKGRRTPSPLAEQRERERDKRRKRVEQCQLERLNAGERSAKIMKQDKKPDKHRSSRRHRTMDQSSKSHDDNGPKTPPYSPLGADQSEDMIVDMPASSGQSIDAAAMAHTSMFPPPPFLPFPMFYPPFPDPSSGYGAYSSAVVGDSSSMPAFDSSFMSTVYSQQPQLPQASTSSTSATPMAYPAQLVLDNNTQRYWWQDQNTETLVFPADAAHVTAVISGDYTDVPYFYYDSLTGLIHQVKSETAVPPASDSTISSIPLPPPTAIENPEPELDAHQKIALLQKQIEDLQKQIHSTDANEPPKDTPSNNLPQQNLPLLWKSATDSEGNVYYYHTKTKHTQWEFPTEEVEAEVIPQPVPPPVAVAMTLIEEASQSQGPSTTRTSLATVEVVRPKKAIKPTTAAADTSSEAKSKIREDNKQRLSKHVIKCLEIYRQDDCKKGRITCQEDFKHLARKLTHAVIEKEKKAGRQLEDLKCTASLMSKTADYIKKYMGKLGDVYIRN